MATLTLRRLLRDAQAAALTRGHAMAFVDVDIGRRRTGWAEPFSYDEYALLALIGEDPFKGRR